MKPTKDLRLDCNWVYSPNMLGKNGGTIGHKPGTKLPTGGNRAARKQACNLQQVAYDTAIQLKETFDNTEDAEERSRLAASITNSVKAWDMSRERIRILDGIAMPGSLRPIAKPKKVRSVSNKPLETLPDTSSTAQYHSDTTPVRTEHAQDKSMLKESLVQEQPSPPSTGVEPV